MGRGMKVVSDLSGMGLGELPHADYPSESLEVWCRHTEAASVTSCVSALPFGSTVPSPDN